MQEQDKNEQVRCPTHEEVYMSHSGSNAAKCVYSINACYNVCVQK